MGDGRMIHHRQNMGGGPVEGGGLHTYHHHPPFYGGGGGGGGSRRDNGWWVEDTVESSMTSANKIVPDVATAGRAGFARHMTTLRFRTLRTSQAQFAKTYGLSLGSVQDQEQGRHEPSRAMKLAVAAIELDPDLMKRAAALAAERWG